MTFNVLVVPGFHGSGDAHWQTWLETQMSESRRVSGIDWERPILNEWSEAVSSALNECHEPTVVVAHSFGCLAAASALAARNLTQKIGVILVAPARPERFSLRGLRDDIRLPSIAQLLPDGPLNIPGLVVASRNDPWMKLQHAYAWSRRWELGFHDAGEAGHINIESGYGPWPWMKRTVEFFGNRLVNQQYREIRSRPLFEIEQSHHVLVYA